MGCGEGYLHLPAWAAGTNPNVPLPGWISARTLSSRLAAVAEDIQWLVASSAGASTDASLDAALCVFRPLELARVACAR